MDILGMYSVLVTEASQVGEARRLANRLANEIQFSEEDAAKVSIIATEMANNLIKHTTDGGEIIINAVSHPLNPCINIWALDKGSGILNVIQALTDGYSTAGTPGTGLGAIKRLSHFFDIYTAPQLGTAMWSQVLSTQSASLYAQEPEINSIVNLAGISVPIKGETLCGDGYSYYINPEGTEGLFLVVDGLGHGDGANEAAEKAINCFKLYSTHSLSLVDLLEKIHKALYKSRGAAISIAKINYPKSTIDFVGLGNVSGVILSESKRQSMVSLGGIVGVGVFRARSYDYIFPANSILIMHTDGLSTRWNENDYPGLMKKSPQLIAGVLYRDFKRLRDDATIFVIKSN